MLKSQKFNPPPSFPALSLSAKERETYSLGMKLTCAFELVASSGSDWGRRVLELWNAEKEKKVDDVAMRSWVENLEEVDGEEWMILSAEDIQRIMAEDKGEEEQIKDMIANLEKFMEGESGFEGIDDGYVSKHNAYSDLTILRVMRSWIEVVGVTVCCCNQGIHHGIQRRRISWGSQFP
jgi:hypothetical protein